MVFGTIALRIAANLMRGRQNDKFCIASLWNSYELFLILSLLRRQAQYWGEIFCKGDCQSFPSMEEKNTYLYLISGPSLLFYGISYQLVWIWDNLIYSIGICVKVCKVLGSALLQRKVNSKPCCDVASDHI